MNYFQQQKLRGKKVEEIVKQHMQSRGHIVQDMSEIPEFQKKDIDFILINKDTNSYTTLEVKRDDNISRTNNFFFEKESEDNYGRVVQGWVEYCEADYLCFYDTKSEHGYIVDWLNAKQLLPTIGTKNYYYDRYDEKLKMSFLVSMMAMKKHELIVYEWEGV